MLIVTILWGPSAAHVTLDSPEMEQHVLVNMITLFGKYDHYFVVDESWFYFIPQTHARSAQKKIATCFQFSRNFQLMAKKDDCGILRREDHTRHKFLVHASFVNPV